MKKRWTTEPLDVTDLMRKGGPAEKVFENVQIREVPSPRKSRKEVAVDVVRESCWELEMKLFQRLQQVDPELAATLKPDFDLWLKTEVEVAKASSDGNDSVADTYHALPGNKWGEFLRALGDRMSRPSELSPDVEKKMKARFRKKVAKRVRGRDVS
ncbi:MAG: hypothetical protein Q8P21_02315 [bacterium]|nr:hypothetical protein [bacterium]